jgi:1-hydroxy-2-methyl-2-(E)-butenyl 4-diphosphate synthase
MFTQIEGFDSSVSKHPRRKTYAVKVGNVRVGGGAPVVVQSMTNTDTADVESTFRQTIELAEAGSEIVRWTVNVPEAAAAVPEIKKRLLEAGCTAPIIGDFHYNGHVLLTKNPGCAAALDKYRINPGNVGAGQRRDEQFSTICKVARDHGKPVRIGVNGGSLNQELVMQKMQENTDHNLGKESEEIINDCMVLSALQSTELALESGLRNDQIIVSCKTSRPRDLITVYRDLSSKTEQPLHLGLTEAGMGTKGLVWSAASLGVLLYDGIGDTIRVSLTPRPGGGSLCRVRTAAVARSSFFFPQRHRLPRLRPHHQHHFSGTGRKCAGLHPRHDARMEDAIRRRRGADPRGDGLHRERPGRIEGREYRHQSAGYWRSSALPRIHRRQKRRHPGRNLRGTCGGFSGSGRQLHPEKVPAQSRGSRPRGALRSPVKITREDVVRVAELAYLDLSESELETYRRQLDEILEYIGKLNELDTSSVEPMAQVLSDDQAADATMREDIVVPCGVAHDILSQAPDPEPPYFRVPKVIERQ